MASISNQPITAEAFLAMPYPAGGAKRELVRGEIVMTSPAGGLHGACCLLIGGQLLTFVREQQLGTVVSNDTGVVLERSPDTVRAPDVAYWSRERLPEVPAGFIEVPPDVAVEAISPRDVFSKVQAKVAEYLARGVRLVWVIEPQTRTMTVYRPSREAQMLLEPDTLSGEDVLPGFTCRVAELFP